MRSAAGMRSLAAFGCVVGLLYAQSSQRLTLGEAQQTAIRNHPRISAARSVVETVSQQVGEARSVYYPSLSAALTGAGALPNSRIAAGAINNPIIYNRYSDGLVLSQLVTDFGRTSNLVASTRLHAQSAAQGVELVREDILFRVTQAYFGVLRHQAVLRVAQDTVKERQVVADQATTLARNKLKSTVDVSFAEVNLADARLLLVEAENGLQASFAVLSESLGYPEARKFELFDVPLPAAPPPDPAPLLAHAMRQRPDIARQEFEVAAAQKFARAERDLRLPTISALSAAGLTPLHQKALFDRYAVTGMNIGIPIFNGHLFGARQAEAESRVRTEGENLRMIQNQVARDVRIAWLNANSAFQRMGLTDQLLAQAKLALNLAETRYRLGLGSIVELSQAQLNQTQAQIQQAAAKYDYQIANAALQYQLGAL